MLVLVAVDDPGLRQTISQTVETERHKAAVARSAAQLFERLASHNPNFVFLDAWLPDTDTRKMICAIQERAPSCKIIFMSRREDPVSIRDALRWGAANYLELNRSEDFVQLQIKCLLSQTQLPAQTPGKALKPDFASAPEISIAPTGLFNGQQKPLAQARQRFEIANENKIPVVIEGDSGTGKATLGRLLVTDFLEDAAGFEFSADIESLQSLEKQIAENSALQWILIKHVENATSEIQLAILDLIKNGYFVVATTRGRLMDHVADNRIGHELYSKLCAAPIWVEKVENRPQDISHVARCFLIQAINLLQVQTSHENHLLQKITQQTFNNGFWGLRQLIFRELLAQQTQDNALGAQGVTSIATEEQQIACPPQAHPNIEFATVRLLDGAGQLRPLSQIEDETLHFAMEHLNGRLGKVAKALGMGRTTLYRKMTQLVGIKPHSQSMQERFIDGQSQPDSNTNIEVQAAGTSAPKGQKTPAKAA